MTLEEMARQAAQREERQQRLAQDEFDRLLEGQKAEYRDRFYADTLAMLDNLGVNMPAHDLQSRATFTEGDDKPLRDTFITRHAYGTQYMSEWQLAFPIEGFQFISKFINKIPQLFMTWTCPKHHDRVYAKIVSNLLEVNNAINQRARVRDEGCDQCVEEKTAQLDESTSDDPTEPNDPPTQQSRADIDHLIDQWERDPQWDLSSTPGFEAHRVELEAVEAKHDAQRQLRAAKATIAELEQTINFANSHGCSPKFARHVAAIETRLSTVIADLADHLNE